MTEPLPEPPARPRSLEEAWEQIDALQAELARLRQRDAAPDPYLQRDVRLSESLLWQMQEDYFREHGIAAWERIPYYVTNNPTIAATYAELIVAFLLDDRAQLDTAAPLYLFEMAAGTGCFSYYLLRELVARLRHHRQLRDLRLCYVIADFTESTVGWLEHNERFAPYLAEGLVDFAIFKPETDTTLRLRHAGVELGPDSFVNPLLAIANYFFDCIRQDAYRTREGQFQEARYNFFRRQKPGANGSQSPFAGLEYTIDYAAAVPDRYGDPAQNEVLRQYAAELPNAAIIFPVGALDTLRNLLTLSGDHLVLLSSDKGFTRESYLTERNEHPFQLHDCFSYMVNFDAVRRYLEARGGQVLMTETANASLVTMLGAVLRSGKPDLDHCSYAFAEHLGKANPINHLFYSQTLLEPESVKDNPQRQLQGLMSFLHVLNYDPVAFGRCAPSFYKALDGLNAGLFDELKVLLVRIYDNYYPNPNQYAASFWLGRAFFALSDPERARSCFQRCIDLRADGPHGYYNLGVALRELGQIDGAVNAYVHYLALAPNAPDAHKVWLQVKELRDQLAAKAPAEVP